MKKTSSLIVAIVISIVALTGCSVSSYTGTATVTEMEYKKSRPKIGKTPYRAAQWRVKVCPDILTSTVEGEVVENECFTKRVKKAEYEKLAVDQKVNIVDGDIQN